MPAKGKGSKRLVIDACIARAAGGKDAAHPLSKHCRDFLEAVRMVCHRLVLTPEIKEEWNKHQSGFARTWRTSMMARKKIELISSPRDEGLRSRVSAALTKETDREAAGKDMLLIEAAVATDRIVTSIDETVRAIFHETTDDVPELASVVWFNPDTEHDEMTSWLEAGAQSEPRMLLNASPASDGDTD